MMPAGLNKLFFSITLLLTTMAIAAQTTVLPNAYSHNDYRRKRPLVDALNNGFRYVEADIYLRKGELIVAHILPCLKKNRTLEALYLKPLLEYVQCNDQQQELNNCPLTLMIDIKSDAGKTYGALLVLLEKYKSILSGYDNGHTTLRNITIVITGHKPYDLIKNTDSGYVFLDDNLRKVAPCTSPDLYPIASCKYSHLLKWKGKGKIPEREMQRLEYYVAEAHKNGSKVRLWASPENKVVWSELLKCNVDLINTNHLSSLRKFLTGANARSL
jgi:hypothetical protein